MPFGRLQKIFKIGKPSTAEHKIIISNFSYITFLEIFILLAPFITYPYLVRILGLDIYGWVITAQITASYFTLLIDFGFKRISAKHIALNIGERDKLSEIVCSIFILRLTLWIISLLIFIALLILIPSYRQHTQLFIFSFFTTLSSVLFLDFYFQGIENMKFITISNLIVRGVFIILTFIIIKDKSDYIYVPLITSIGYVIGGLLSIFIGFHQGKLRLILPSLAILKSHLKEGSIIFFSDIVIAIKDKLNYNVMGAVLGMSDVVIYDIGSKISNLLQKPSSILASVLYPRIVKTKSKSLINKTILIAVTVTLFACLLVNIFLPQIVKFFVNNTVDLLAIRIYTAAPIILAISVNISLNVFFAFGRNGLVFKSALITTVAYLLLLGIMYYCGILNTVMSYVLLTITAYLIELLYRLKLCKDILMKRA